MDIRNTTIPLAWAALLCLAATWPGIAVGQTEAWAVQGRSHVRVEGKTNINTFECGVPQYGRVDTIFCTRRPAHAPVSVVGYLTIPVVKFDCRHRTMTRDLRKTLQWETHPTLEVQFISFSRALSAIGQEGVLQGRASICLAGVSRPFDISYTVRHTGQGRCELVGTQRIQFSDFGLQAPSKMGGAIRVHDELRVVFELQLRRVE